jgi:hypothetical protein
MFSAALIVAAGLLADPDAASPGGPAPAEAAPAPIAPPEPVPPPRRPRRYGDQGMPEIGIGAGYSSLVGFVAAGAFRYFVVNAVAPGVEGTYVSGGSTGTEYGLLLASLRLVPVRTGSFALLLTGRGGRVLLGNHDDGWGIGGAIGVLILFAPMAGLELGYEALRLYPSSVCADLSTCVLQGPVIGVRFGF